MIDPTGWMEKFSNGIGSYDLSLNFPCKLQTQIQGVVFKSVNSVEIFSRKPY